MRFQVGVLACCLGLFVLAESVSGHHSFAATYDRNKPVALKGTVIMLEWRNPHIWLDLDVSGVVWKCEGVAPNQLYRQGWSKNTLKPGDSITVQGYMARNVANMCNLGTVTLPNGKQVLAGTNPDSER